MPKKTLSVLGLTLLVGGSAAGMFGLHAQKLSSDAVFYANRDSSYRKIDDTIKLAVLLCKGAVWVVKGILSVASAILKSALVDGSKGPLEKVKAPELKKGINFIAIQNTSKANWSFQVAPLDSDAKLDKDHRNDQGLPKSSEVMVLKVNRDAKGEVDKQAPIVVLGVVGPDGKSESKVALEPGEVYLLYPVIDGKFLGSKRWATDFNRVVNLEDASGKKLAFNLVRKAESKALITFGVTANSNKALYESKGVEWSMDEELKNIYLITQDSLKVAPERPN